MASTVSIDFGQVSQSLGLATARVHTVVELLDAGNTVPFITRYRKDQTGGLDEEQIGQIQSRVVKLRLLAERKQTIVRSIESQGKLTVELGAAIQAADTTKQLEDLYLPFKPKKQTLATVARSRGLEPLAVEILGADPAAADLDLRARDFVNPDRQVLNAADALLGAGHILAEMFSERAELRGKLRSILEHTGKLVSTGAESEAATKEKAASQPPAASAASAPPPPPPPPPDAAAGEPPEPAAGEQGAGEQGADESGGSVSEPPGGSVSEPAEPPG
ncbi:MAG: Tex-like N-terminal domain-containing protein, partial [Pirellulales bacterium]